MMESAVTTRLSGDATQRLPVPVLTVLAIANAMAVLELVRYLRRCVQSDAGFD